MVMQTAIGRGLQRMMDIIILICTQVIMVLSYPYLSVKPACASTSQTGSGNLVSSNPYLSVLPALPQPQPQLLLQHWFWRLIVDGRGFCWSTSILYKYRSPLHMNDSQFVLYLICPKLNKETEKVQNSQTTTQFTVEYPNKTPLGSKYFC